MVVPCVVGQNAYIASYSGRYAHVVGYDPDKTKSAKIPIVTAYIKALAHNGIPVLLKINEAPYNAGSPVTLLSEYQIRENQFVIDSVAKKHRSMNDQFGTQRLTLNEVVYIPFEDRGGIMGFEILPIEDGDIDEIDLTLDIFEITQATKWTPARFRTNTIETTSETLDSTPEPPSEELDEEFICTYNHAVIPFTHEAMTLSLLPICRCRLTYPFLHVTSRVSCNSTSSQH